MNTLTNKALEYEKYVAYQLKLQGFCKVELTKTTADYGADILCYDLHGNRCAVQCKYYSKPVGYKAVEETLAGARYYNCQRALLITNKCFTKNAKEGAKRIGVELYVFFSS